MSFADTVITRSLIVQARRQSTKKGDQYQRVAFVSLAQHTIGVVAVSRVTTNCIYFTDGNRVKKDTGRVINKTEGVVSYIPA
jgi:hypothetical protein